ncbi:hypothetical protein KKB18_02010 [bacterium]|nr:hypothetical protein [bacterium]
MAVITKQINLVPSDIFYALKGLSSEEKIEFLSLCEESIEIDPVHNLPKSFVKEIKAGLEEVKKGHTEPFDYRIYE